MELRQLRYFVKIVEIGSMGRAAVELELGTSALSRQISSLEGELSTRLLQRTSTGIVPTAAGMAFLRQAQLTLRHANAAVEAAQDDRLSGQLSVGLLPSTASVLAMPLVLAMRDRYPGIRLRITEALSGSLAMMLSTRQLDLAIVAEGHAQRKWDTTELLEEQLFVMGRADLATMPTTDTMTLAQLAGMPLVLPSDTHALRQLVIGACQRAGVTPQITMEVDGLAVLMDVVANGLGATVQPGCATVRWPAGDLRRIEILDTHVRRRNLLASLPEDELSPPALAGRVVLKDIIVSLVRAGKWPGARLLMQPTVDEA